MWRKIHSKRDPGDTLYSELAKEFGAYLGKAKRPVIAVLRLYPRFFFGAMVLLLLASVILSFTPFRHPEAGVAKIRQPMANPVVAGFGKILQAAARIRETLQLKHLVDSISSRPQLSGADSTRLDSALSRLQQIKQPIN